MRTIIISFLLLQIFHSEGQTRVISGIVMESISKEALIGAVVYHPDTKNMTTTDLYGKFLLKLPHNGKTYLFIDYTGYHCKFQMVDIGDEFIEVRLEPGSTIPPLSIIEFKRFSSENTRIDSISKICNKYLDEIDSILHFKINNKN